MLIFFVITILLICTLVAKTTLQLLEHRFHRLSFSSIPGLWKLYPLIGIIIIMNFFQVLQIILPANKSFFLLYGAVFFCIWYLKDHRKRIVIFVKAQWKILGLLLLCLIFMGFPILAQNELCSIQSINNDIQFYLATMDWLYEHNLREPIIYSDSMPYFFCAEKIIHSTRFGFDILGSLFMACFNLSAHQVFTGLGIVSILVANLTANFFLVDILNVPEKYGNFLLLFLSVSYNWYSMLLMQYLPQILGIAALMGFVSSLMLWLIDKKRDAWLLAALMLSGTATVYAEFCSYMFIIFIGFWAIRMWMDRHQIKVLSKNFLESIGMAGAACLMNPLGIFVAIRFNLSIFLKVADSPSNIDAWGNIKNLPGIAAVLMGGIGVGNPGNYTYIINIYSLLLLLALVLFLCLFFIAQKHMNSKKLAILWTLVFFSGYELYFHCVRLAYGEFKHLSSISIFFTIYCFYYFFIFISSKKRNRLILSFSSFSFLCFLILNIISICVKFPLNSSFYLGSQLSKLQEIEAYIPSGTSVTIVGDGYDKQHGAIYALKDFPVQIAGTRSNSYYTDGGIPYSDEWGEYALLPMINGELTVRNGYEYVWDNKLYYLFKNTNLPQ